MPFEPPAYAAVGLRHVFVRDLMVDALVGVHGHERVATQRVRLNIDLGVIDDVALAAGGSLAQVVDYAAIAQTARAIVNSGHIVLVETLAERIAYECLKDRRVAVVRVRVEKPDALADARAVGVEIERQQP